MYGPTRLLQGKREKWDGEKFVEIDEIKIPGTDEVADYSVASNVHDYYEMSDINNPEITEDYRKRLFMKLRAVKHPEAMMPKGTTMVPRVFKTNVGDIFTTNTVAIPVSVVDGVVVEDLSGIVAGKFLAPNDEGYLAPAVDDAAGMLWQIVKVYTLADRQRAVKIMRIA
jgi:hypothetical protein